MDVISRIKSVDTVRGAVMVFMALDHVRDYVTNLRIRPEDLSQSSTALFFTRWITHFCAPTFFLLAGVGIGLGMFKNTRFATSRYLLTRGLWLIVLDLIITPIGWNLSLHLIPAFALVLWALGCSMILMALLIHLPNAVLGAICLTAIFGHNLLDGVNPESLGAWAGFWHFLHVPGFAVTGKLFVAYPFIPWFGVMGVGLLLANVYRWEAARRKTFLLRAGLAATLLFIVLRAFNTYGNPQPWSQQRTIGLTISSFLNVNKYPPSLHFLLMTLGPALIALALTENWQGRMRDWLLVYGRVPLFFYVVHIAVAHAAAITIAWVQQGRLMRIPIIADPASIPPDHGVPLWGVYIVWLTVVAILYVPCRHFAKLKETRKDWWLRYM